MNSRYILLAVFVLVAAVQIYVPAGMILNREKILKSGKEFKFRTAPVDPTDPFRGKYITLSFEDNIVEVETEEEWVMGETVYALLSTDKEGFAEIQSVSKTVPLDNDEYLKVKVSYVSTDGSGLLTIEYPFDRFYMEESKAPEAELTYRESLSDSDRITWALVNVRDGEAVLKDVLIDGESISEIIRKERTIKNHH